MSTEPEGGPQAGGGVTGAAARPENRGVAALALVLAAVVVTGLLLLRREGAAARPLPPPASRTLVVLLAPGASLSDWRDGGVMPALAGLGAGVTGGSSACVGLLPARREDVPWRAEVGGEDSLWTPVTPGDLVRASRALGGPSLGAALREGGAQAVALGADPAARSFLGEPPVPPPGAEAPLTAYADQDAEQWRSRRPDAVDGFVTDPDRLARAISRATAPSPSSPGAPAPPPAPRLVVATYDDLLRGDAYAPLALPSATGARRRVALGGLDALVARLTGGGAGSGLPPGAALLVVTPLAPADAAARGDLLGPALYWDGAAAAAPGLLTSPSTRHTPGLLAPGDVAPTVAALLGLPSPRGTGRPAEAASAGGGTTLAGRAAAWAGQLRVRYWLVGVPWALAALLALAALARSGRPVAGAALVFTAGAALLALLYVPPDVSGVAIAAGVLLAAAAVGAGAAARRDPAVPRRALDGLCLLSVLAAALLVILDGATGGAALARCPLSYAPALGARYYGLGNELSGVLLGASLFSVPLAGSGVAVAALGGLAVALLMGLPSLGADAGGFAAALVAYGTWAAPRLGIARRVGAASAGAGAAVLLLVALFVLGNGALPAGARTHVGQAVVEARAGGVGAMAPMLLRKASADARLLVTSPWSALLLTEAALLAWRWRRRGLPAGAEGRTIVAACAGAGVLLLLNDSGSAAAATCLLYPTARLLLGRLDPLQPGSDRHADGGQRRGGDPGIAV